MGSGLSMEMVVKLGQDMMFHALLVGLPMLGVALVVGVLISIIQAATQVNEQTLTIVPKLVVVGTTLMFCMPWIISVLTEYATNLINLLPTVIGR